MIFINLAKSIARGEGLLVRGVETLGYGPAYPARPVAALRARGRRRAGVRGGPGGERRPDGERGGTGVPARAHGARAQRLGARRRAHRRDTVADVLGLRDDGVRSSTPRSSGRRTPSRARWRARRRRCRPSRSARSSFCARFGHRPIVLIPAVATAVGLLALRGRRIAAVLRTYGILLTGLAGVTLAGAAL